MTTTLKLNWVGSSDKFEGYGYFSEKLLEALSRRSDVDVMPLDRNQLDWPAWKLRAANIDLGRPTVFVGQPRDSHRFRPIPGRLILFTMYESEAIPENWVAPINENCAQVLVPCQMNKDVFEERLDVPVDVVPGGIDPTEFPIVTRWPDRPFTFMALGDRGMRKGWDLVWAAYSDLFADHSDTRFIMKARRGGVLEFAEYRSVGDMSVWRQDAATMADVYAEADCFVFPTRGEGYGLPPREAAIMGIPTIVTDYAGTANSEDWAFPISHSKMASIMPAGGLWAKPDLDELKDRMWGIYKHKEIARDRAIAKAWWLRRNETWAHAANKLMKVVAE